MRFKPPLTPKPLIFIFSLIILSAFLILSVTWFFTEKSTKDYSISLQKFKSDFKNKDQKKALFKDEIFKMNRFIAFGSYITVPEGIYRADFYIQSKSDLEVTLVLQMVSHKGKTIDLSKKSNIKHFPSKHSVHFKVFSHKEVEPRVLYVSGNRDIQLKKVEINKLKGIFPWKRLLYKSMFFGFFFSLILFAFFHTFENAIRWNFFLNLFFLLMGFFFILRTTWVSEDAFIILRHVDNFLAGLGPVFNAGERVEGYTSPLWFYIVSLFRWAGFSPKGALVFPSLMISFTALYILIFKITFSHDTTKRLHLNPGVAILIGTSAFIDFGTSGLETSLTYLLLIIYAKLIAEEKWLTYPTLMGLVVTLLVFTRPDFGILLIFMMGFYLFQLWGKKVKPRQFFLFLTFPLSLLGGYQLF